MSIYLIPFTFSFLSSWMEYYFDIIGAFSMHNFGQGVKLQRFITSTITCNSRVKTDRAVIIISTYVIPSEYPIYTGMAIRYPATTDWLIIIWERIKNIARSEMGLSFIIFNSRRRLISISSSIEMISWMNIIHCTSSDDFEYFKHRQSILDVSNPWEEKGVLWAMKLQIRAVMENKRLHMIKSSDAFLTYIQIYINIPLQGTILTIYY